MEGGLFLCFCVSSAGLPGTVKSQEEFVRAPSCQGNVSGRCGKRLGLLEDKKVGFLSAGWTSKNGLQ